MQITELPSPPSPDISLDSFTFPVPRDLPMGLAISAYGSLCEPPRALLCA
jgi:hypothetical protein